MSCFNPHLFYAWLLSHQGGFIRGHSRLVWGESVWFAADGREISDALPLVENLPCSFPIYQIIWCNVAYHDGFQFLGMIPKLMLIKYFKAHGRILTDHELFVPFDTSIIYHPSMLATYLYHFLLYICIQVQTQIRMYFFHPLFTSPAWENSPLIFYSFCILY